MAIQSVDQSPGTFVENMRLPVHRWFRYSAGFGGQWAEEVISQEVGNPEALVFDPFAGSGTTLIAAEQCGVQSRGIDSHPFVARVAKAKLAYRSSPREYVTRAGGVLERAKRHTPSLDSYAPLIRKCYSDSALEQLDCLRAEVEATRDGSDSDLLVWMTLVSILRSTSQVGTANWQYLLPRQRKSSVKEPYEAFEEMINVIGTDMWVASSSSGPRAKFEVDDARLCSTVPNNKVTLVVTSPPYANNYDYADATRLELTFFGEIDGWGDLQSHIRRHLIRSCTQHVPNRSIDLPVVLARPELDPIKDEIQKVCEDLGNVRMDRGGKKTYHNMVACYFLDLAQVWLALRRVCKSPSNVCFVVGDSAPYGVYVPTIEWLGRLAVAAGFSSYSFTKTRDRNVKWKNRKHRVPLCEGQLWVEG
jgi:DNA modification methylase